MHLGTFCTLSAHEPHSSFTFQRLDGPVCFHPSQSHCCAVFPAAIQWPSLSRSGFCKVISQQLRLPLLRAAKKLLAFLLSFDGGGGGNNKESGIYILPVYLILRPPSARLGAMLWLSWSCGFQPNAEPHGSHPTCAFHARARLHTSACCVYVSMSQRRIEKSARGRACSTIPMSKCIGLFSLFVKKSK